ncbi:MAG TPA: DUF1269 domain-containing protein [Chloroflexota bacterium]|nr:DUF1269 domain-containing protein [Chloroflexota bacterium]
MVSSNANYLRGPHIVGLFATRDQAEQALDTLLSHDFPSDSISTVSADGKPISFPTAQEERYDTGVRDTAIGAAVGGVAGLLIFGPLLLLTGALVGGAIGLLTALGINQSHAEYLTEKLQSGHYLVVVHTDNRETEATTVLENAGASDVHRAKQ